MELTLKRLLEQAEFNQVRRGGYDRDEVNTLLDRAVAMATKVEAKLTETLEQARNASGPAPADVEAEIERRVAAEIAARPPAPSGPSDEEQAEQVARALVIAQQSADAAIAEARRDAERIRAEAANQAEEDGRRAKERVRAEIDELEGIRESLRTDIGLLERHVEEQRSQLRSTVGELQRLLEDPKGFRLAPTPAVSEVRVPEDEPEPPTSTSTEAAASRSPESTPAAVPASNDPAPEPVEDDDPVADGSLDFGEVDHAPPGLEPSGPTQPVPAVTADDDLFMAELRKAIEDEEPLGPRESDFVDDDSDPFGPERRGWRFGRR